MRSDTQSVTIEAPAGDVFAFVADPASLPRWAVGFAQAIRPDGDRWVVTTGQGAEVTVRYRADPDRGTVDFDMEPAPGVTTTAYARVVPNGMGADVIFTQQQPPSMPDETFDAQVEALRHELTVLKALVEVSCPA
jgi:uncharacterized protein YndB with AHSA1/START domain